jgi:hypothetical protein
MASDLSAFDLGMFGTGISDERRVPSISRRQVWPKKLRVEQRLGSINQYRLQTVPLQYALAGEDKRHRLQV